LNILLLEVVVPAALLHQTLLAAAELVDLGQELDFP
jgi:hypothetical protein